jgi:hypothetical protein
MNWLKNAIEENDQETKFQHFQQLFLQFFDYLGLGYFLV